MKKLFLILLSLTLFPSLAFSKETLTVMTHDSFNISKELIAEFEQKNNVTIRFLKGNDGGAMLVQAILSKENPVADILYGVDNTFFSRAIEADIFEPYSSPLLAHIPDELKLDPKHRLLPVDYGDVCLNYDKKWFNDKAITPPTSLDDLITPEYRGLTVIENPATSTPGLAFLLATIGHYGDGEKEYLDFWKKLKENEVLIVDGWSDAYFNHFTAASKGDRPVVVSYASSPAAAVYYSETKTGPAPTAAVIENHSAFRQIEFVGILKGTKKKELAEKFIDFMLSRPFQEDIPLQMFVFPVNRNAVLPDIFQEYAQLAPDPVVVEPRAIEENREAWIEAWSNLMLR